MSEIKQLKKRFDLAQYPPDWSLCAFSTDWAGEPLILFAEGKPPQPRYADAEALINWFRLPVKRHHLIHLRGSQVAQTSFDNSADSFLPAHVQPYGDGWLLAEGRGGAARICDQKGNPVRTLDLGDASEQILTTPEGHIWVSYFDEGVFGSGISTEGLVCFNSHGVPIFKFNEFAGQNGLPFISDCYSLNVGASSVWVSYYTDFPLVWLKQFKLERAWSELPANNAIAVRGDRFVIFPAYRGTQLETRTFESAETVTWELIDAEGKKLTDPVEDPMSIRSGHDRFKCAVRDARLYLYNDTVVHELP